MHSTNCPMISGFSGFPKFIQSVIAIGSAPDATILRQVSTTACFPPSYGLCLQYVGEQSVLIAIPLLVPCTLTTAASEPGRTTVSAITM